MNLQNSLKWWEQYGQYVLMATSYHDQVIVQTSQCNYRDADGNNYLDMNSGTMCALVGHHHPELMDRVSKQLKEVVHTGTSFLSPVVFEASAKLAAVTPDNLQKSVFFSTGAEANEYALRMAKAYTGKSSVLALTKGYSGLTLAMAALTSGGRRARPRVPGCGYILTPDASKCPPDRTLEQWTLELFQHSLELNDGILDDVAAIIVEPIPSTGGMIVLPEGFLRMLRGLADELGALLIADEAQTGLGRTGRWWGIDHEGVKPDILCAAKGMGGGFPVSAVITTPQVADTIALRMSHYSSHQSDQLAAAAALAVLEIVEREGLVERAAASGEYLIAQLRQVAARRPELQGIRGRGLMVGFDVVPGESSKLTRRTVGEGIVEHLHERGVHVHPIQNKFRIMPPLTIERAELDRFVSVLDDALAALQAGTLQSHGPRNQYTRAIYDGRSTPKGVRGAMKWAWTQSPQSIVKKLRKRFLADGSERKQA